MKNEIKKLYKKDAKLAKQVAATLGYKIIVADTAKDKTEIKNLLDNMIKSAKEVPALASKIYNIARKNEDFNKVSKILGNLVSIYSKDARNIESLVESWKSKIDSI